MAQSKREQINMVGAEIKRVARNTVPDLLLQQHRESLVGARLVRTSSRALFLLMASVLVLVNSFSAIHLIATVSIASLLACLWYSEKRRWTSLLLKFEEVLARRSGDEWEDIYIESRFHRSEQERSHRLLTHEPLIWAILLSILAALRFYLERKLGS